MWRSFQSADRSHPRWVPTQLCAQLRQTAFASRGGTVWRAVTGGEIATRPYRAIRAEAAASGGEGAHRPAAVLFGNFRSKLRLETSARTYAAPHSKGARRSAATAGTATPVGRSRVDSRRLSGRAVMQAWAMAGIVAKLEERVAAAESVADGRASRGTRVNPYRLLLAAALRLVARPWRLSRNGWRWATRADPAIPAMERPWMGA